MKFSVIIPTFNNLAELKRCLAALERISEKNFEVLVCIDGSTDDTAVWLGNAEFNFPVQVLQHPGNENRGRSATRNLALGKVSGQYTLFIDSDMEATENLFEAHLSVLEKGNTVSIGKVSYRNAEKNIWVKYTSERGVCKYNDGEKVPFHYFITPNTAIPTVFFTENGGFDENINRYGGEDMEFGYRIHKKYNPDFIFNASAEVSTSQPKTLEEALPQLREYGATGLRYIAKKWPELAGIYWVNKCDSGKMKDRLFEILTKQPFRSIGKALSGISPYFIRKHLISYLVISYIHEGYSKERK